MKITLNASNTESTATRIETGWEVEGSKTGARPRIPNPQQLGLKPCKGDLIVLSQNALEYRIHSN